LAPAQGMQNLNIIKDLHRQLKAAHFGIAEISNNNLNVLYEAGLLHGMGKPLILLRRDDSRDEPPFDIFSDYQAKYVVNRRGPEVEFTWLEKEMDKAMQAVFHMLPELQRVPVWEGKDR